MNVGAAVGGAAARAVVLLVVVGLKLIANLFAAGG
jgi:hypothetical protein